ncbi:hypothetical protein Tco_1484555 [Tanacetum coccineum]
MVINSHVNDTKDWPSPVQTTSGKNFSNPLIADSLLTTYMILKSPSFTVKKWASPSNRHLKDDSKQGRIDDADAEVTFIDETSNDARNKNNKISNNN